VLVVVTVFVIAPGDVAALVIGNAAVFVIEPVNERAPHARDHLARDPPTTAMTAAIAP
jgi:hypothetical protein